MKYFKWIIGLLTIAIGTPLFLEFCIFRNNFPSVLDNGEWASFLGSFLGGVVSLVGIFITIRFTQAENKKERELMYKPYIRVKKCKPTNNQVYIPISTVGTHVMDGKNCSIAIRIENVGLGPILGFEIQGFDYIRPNGEKIRPIEYVPEGFLGKEDVLELLFEFNLDIHDEDLEGLDANDTEKLIPFMEYGGELKFKLVGCDLCETSYEKDVRIRISSQICGDQNGKLKYVPEAHLV